MVTTAQETQVLGGTAILNLKRTRGWWLAALAALILIALLTPLQPALELRYGPDQLATNSKKGNTSGFYLPEIDRQGIQYLWTQPQAVLPLDFESRQPLDLKIELRSAAAFGGPASPVAVQLNGSPVGQLRPEPQNSNFQTFILRLPATGPAPFRLTFSVAEFKPASDPRSLGVMIKSITIDRRSAWGSFSNRRLLYWLLPGLMLLGLTLAAFARRLKNYRWRALAGYATCLSFATGLGLMLAALFLLWRVGVLDRPVYTLWFVGTLYLAAFFGAVGLGLPWGDPASLSLWRRSNYLQWRELRRVPADGFLIFMAGVWLAISWLPFSSTSDVSNLMLWQRNAELYGLRTGFEANGSNYPPLTLVLLKLVARLAHLVGNTNYAEFKVSLLVAWLLIGFFLLAWTRNLFLTALVQLFLLLNSVGLGYIDVWSALPVLLALYALQRRKLFFFGLAFTTACFIKWQPVLFGPVFLVYLSGIDNLKDWRRIPLKKLLLQIGIPAGLLTGGILLYFGHEVVLSFQRAIGYEWLSGNALNFNWIVTHFVRVFYPELWGGLINGSARAIVTDDWHLVLLPKIIFFGLEGLILVVFFQRPKTFENLLLFSTAAYLNDFIFNVNVHENHLYLVCLLTALLAWQNRRYWPLFVISNIVSDLNLFLFYGIDGTEMTNRQFYGLDLALVVAIFNVLFFGAFLLKLVRSKPDTPQNLFKTS